MQELPCFVCAVVTNIYCKDVKSLRSKHTDTNILTYLEKFVGYDLSDNLNRSQSVVCQNCMIKIDEYDELYMNAMSLEDDLRSILLNTLDKQNEVEEADNPIDIADDSEDVGCEEIEEVSVSSISSSKLPSMFCNICRRTFDSFTELKNHEHIQTEKQKKIPNVEKFSTKIKKNPPVAAGTFINYNNVMIQQQPKFEELLSKGPTLKCSMCSSMFYNKVAIKEHYKECHYDESRCDVCGGLYADKVKLKEHRDRHAKTSNPLECVECNKVFKARNPLMRHMATHTHERFYVCELCGKQFTHHSSFKMHMMAHDDVRDKKCEECGHLFRSSSHLNRHKRVHTNEKPYECLICHRLFAQRYNMMSHFKSHSKESQSVANKKSHACTVCEKHFPTSNKLKEHCETVHYVIDSNES